MDISNDIHAIQSASRGEDFRDSVIAVLRKIAQALSIDNIVTANSSNLITSGAVAAYTGGGSSNIELDDKLDRNSNNAVSNAAISEALDILTNQINQSSGSYLGEQQFDATSDFPVANKVITVAMNNLNQMVENNTTMVQNAAAANEQAIKDGLAHVNETMEEALDENASIIADLGEDVNTMGLIAGLSVMRNIFIQDENYVDLTGSVGAWWSFVGVTFTLMENRGIKINGKVNSDADASTCELINGGAITYLDWDLIYNKRMRLTLIGKDGETVPDNVELIVQYMNGESKYPIDIPDPSVEERDHNEDGLGPQTKPEEEPEEPVYEPYKVFTVPGDATGFYVAIKVWNNGQRIRNFVVYPQLTFDVIPDLPYQLPWPSIMEMNDKIDKVIARVNEQSAASNENILYYPYVDSHVDGYGVWIEAEQNGSISLHGGYDKASGNTESNFLSFTLMDTTNGITDANIEKYAGYIFKFKMNRNYEEIDDKEYREGTYVDMDPNTYNGFKPRIKYTDSNNTVQTLTMTLVDQYLDEWTCTIPSNIKTLYSVEILVQTFDNMGYSEGTYLWPVFIPISAGGSSGNRLDPNNVPYDTLPQP